MAPQPGRFIITLAGTQGNVGAATVQVMEDGGSVRNEIGEALAGVMVTLWPKTPDASAIALSEGGQESKDLKPVPAAKVAAAIAKLP